MLFDDNKLIELYKIYTDEERYFLREHHERVKWFSGMLSAVAGSIAVGFFRASTPDHFLVIAGGAVIMLLLSSLAVPATARMYYRFVEAISKTAKIEQMMGATVPVSYSDGRTIYWNGEPIVSSRNTQSRSSCRNSDEFVKTNSQLGYGAIVRSVFRSFQAISITIFLSAIYVYFHHR